MEYIRRFYSFLSKLNCNNSESISTKDGFQKCDDLPGGEIQKKSCKNYDLDRSVHKEIIDQELPEPEEILEVFEVNRPIYFDVDTHADVGIDYFDEYRNHELSDSDDEFTNVIIQPVD
jgi:hypothetical protein